MRLFVLFVFFPLIFAASAAAEELFETLDRALLHPQAVTTLSLSGGLEEDTHLTEAIGTLENLRIFELSCYENLQDLPQSIGTLEKLEQIIIDNGTGCSMHLILPETLGKLHKLRSLRLVAAIDGRSMATGAKPLPASLANLSSLEELELASCGLSEVPPQIAPLTKLRMLSLQYNNIHELPAFVGQLRKLKSLNLAGNGGITLPQTLEALDGVRIDLGNNHLSLNDQHELQKRFPKAVFLFENEYDDAAANEEAK